MMLTIHMNALSKSDQKTVMRAYGMGAATVAGMRALLLVGPFGAALMTAMTFLALLGVGLLFSPFLFIAPLALILTPFKVAADNRKWDLMLPAERSNEAVRLV